MPIRSLQGGDILRAQFADIGEATAAPTERLTNRVQISSDSVRSYVDAVERAFGADVDSV